uniref:DNA replication protein DnaC n=1 Tax=uncultured bacterium contig00025 TaxID=1181514 RepID=A0A806KMY0_9BACT|nr:DNA replication protein DnaC [uncultured bacterium contig00025]
MSYKTVFNDVMRSYETDRARAAALLRERREEVWRLLPRVREIDTELSGTGASVSRMILNGAGDRQRLLEDLKRGNDTLKTEKERLLAENNIPADYFNNIYRCALCGDTGFLPEEDGVTPRCGCLKQRLIDKYHELSTVRELIKTENFDTFDLRYYSEDTDPQNGVSPRRNIQMIYQVALRFVRDFDKEFQNLLFYGATGLGKTFLCNCVAKDLLDAGHTVLYATAPQLFKMTEDYRFNRDEMEEPDEAMDAVTEVDLLILDDLGAEFATVVTSAALFDIVNRRLLMKKHTVVSTNLSPSEFETQYSDRIVSRFLGQYKMLKFFGEDIRAKKKYKGVYGD